MKLSFTRVQRNTLIHENLIQKLLLTSKHISGRLADSSTKLEKHYLKFNCMIKLNNGFVFLFLWFMKSYW